MAYDITGESPASVPVEVLVVKAAKLQAPLLLTLPTTTCGSSRPWWGKPSTGTRQWHIGRQGHTCTMWSPVAQSAMFMPATRQ